MVVLILLLRLGVVELLWEEGGLLLELGMGFRGLVLGLMLAL